MTTEVKKEGKFSYIEQGEGTPIIVLHGLMGGLSNFEDVISFFSDRYKVVVPELPLFTMPLLTTSVKTLAKNIQKFIKYKKKIIKTKVYHIIIKKKNQKKKI